MIHPVESEDKMAFRSGGRISDHSAIVGCIDPDAYTANTYSTDVIDMQLWDKVVFYVQVGTMASTSTVDFSVKGDTASGGSYATAVTGKAITQLTEAGTDSDKQAIVEVTQAEVAAQGLRYIRGDLVVAAAASDAGVLAVAFGPNYAPASENDLASVDEIVA